MIPGGDQSEAARSLSRILTDLRWGHVAGERPDVEEFVHSDACQLQEEDSFCISRPVSLPDAEEMLRWGDAHRRFETLIGQDPSLSCSEVWMGVRREGDLTPWSTQQVICSGEKTPPTKLDACWAGRYPYDYEVTQIRRLSKGDMRGFAIPGSWEIAAQVFAGASEGWSGEETPMARTSAIALSRDVLLEDEHLQLRLGLSAGYTARPYPGVDENGLAAIHAVEGALVALAPELRLYTGTNVFVTAVFPAVGHVFSTEGSEGWTLDVAGGVGYQLTNLLSVQLRAVMATVPAEDAIIGGGTVELTMRL